MNPRLRQTLIGLAASVVAVWLGWEIADRSFFWPVLAAVVALAAILVRLTRLPFDVITLGLAVFGYIVGNRGFAQLSLSGTFPVLPAEFVLLVAGGILAVQSAFRRELPVRRDVLNLALLVWIAVGGFRILFDFRVHGFTAVRDFATIYYALFFFVAQQQARDDAARRFLLGSLLVGTITLLPVFGLFQLFPEFFLSTLTFRGIPLVFYKNDLVYTFLAAGSVIVFHLAAGKRWRFLGYLGALLLGGFVLVGNSRATLMGLVTAIVWLLVGRRTAYAKAMIGGGLCVALGLLLATWLSGRDWRDSGLFVVYERAASVFDPQGARAYASAELADKPDNNRFRMVWWHSVVAETWQEAPVFGLGFGYDLAENFLHIYDLGDDFVTRSPHSILITVIGRMGLVGLLPFLVMMGSMAARTWRAVRRTAAGDTVGMSLWCCAWIILVSACFGVVLEGPMGAVVFWTMLGLASATSAAEREQRNEENAASAVAEPAAVDAPPATA